MGRILIPKPNGIPVASTNTIILNNALSYYQEFFGQGYFISNSQSFTKIDSTTYFDGAANYIRFYVGRWEWGWDNGDNGYTLLELPTETNPNFVPTNWGSGITITANNRKNISIKKQNLDGGKLNAKRNIAAPSGFPNVGTNGQQIYIISTPGNEVNGTYTKTSDGSALYGAVNASVIYKGPYVPNGDWFAHLIFNTDTNQWEIGGVADWNGNGYEWLAYGGYNPSSNQNVIPLIGWSNPVTITAA